MKMVSDQNSAHIDTLKLKATIIRKMGHRRAEKYFGHLSRLFTFKISKCEFDKLCFRTIGKENTPVHNRFIRSIVKSACLTKAPLLRGSYKSGARVTNSHQRNDLQSLCGDAFPSKVSSLVNRDCKFQGLVYEAEGQESPTELLSLGSRPPIEVAASVEEGEEVEQMAGSPSVQSRSPITAPLGIYVRGARKALSNIPVYKNDNILTCRNSGELPDTRTLRNRLEQKLEMEGISVSMNCANLLNNGLDAYLRRVIEPCLSLAGSRSGNENMKQLNSTFVTGLNGIVTGRCTQRSAKPARTSFLDFRVAMEINPQLLGEDWPIQLEKISQHQHACEK